jgi:hypothetical protein
MSKEKLPVAKRVMIDRLNRRLASEGRKLRVSRSHAEQARGAYHIVEGGKGVVDACKDDAALEKLARKLGALQEFETMT